LQLLQYYGKKEKEKRRRLQPHLSHSKTATSIIIRRFDMMGYAAAFDAGFDQTQYDLNVLFMPKCWGQSFAGIGWVGIEGALQNSQLLDYDASVAHELVRKNIKSFIFVYLFIIIDFCGATRRAIILVQTTRAT